MSLERKSEQREAVVRAHLELAFADLARRVERGYIDQRFSPLGPRRHVEAVRRRCERGEAGAIIIGRRYLLTIDALADEYFRPEPASVRLRRAVRALLRTPPANENGGAS